MTSKSKRRVTLALQGGGAHGAFAWGALDAILARGDVEIRAVTATSGGALTAAVLVDALTGGGSPREAREALATFWKKVSVAAGMLPFRPTAMDKFLSNVGIDLSPSSIALDYFTKLFSPYQFNLFDLNPFRAILEEMVDFDRLREQTEIPLFINATAVKTGKSRIFTGQSLSVDAVMASSCLPYLFRAVTLNDEAYWDGGYSGNPSLYPVLDENLPRDVLLIRSSAPTSEDVPTRAADILDRATEISFESALLHEIRALEDHNREHPDRAVRLHIIEADELLAGLGRASKLNADADFLAYLHDLGAQAAADWAEALEA